MLDEQTYENRSWLSWLKKILVSAVIFVLIFLLVKTFYLNRPELSPAEATIFYLKAEQNFERETAEKYLFSNLEKVEMLGEKYQDLRKIRWVKKEKDGKEPVFAIKSQRIEKKEAIINISEKSNKKEGLPFFDYFLPEELVFDVWLGKVGNWKEGYQWRLIKVNSADLVLNKKLGEKIEISRELFLRPINIEEYWPENVKLPEGIKIISLEIEYENKGADPVRIYLFDGWKIITENGSVFGPPSLTSALVLREPIPYDQELEPAQIKKGYIVFEVPKEISLERVKKILFRNLDKKIIFQIE
jgi:hypothetical protein